MRAINNDLEFKLQDRRQLEEKVRQLENLNQLLNSDKSNLITDVRNLTSEIDRLNAAVVALENFIKTSQDQIS